MGKDEKLGPHPTHVGPGSLLWNDVDKDIVNEIRNNWGLPNQTTT